MKFEHPLGKYVREGALPHSHCAGCGNGTVAQCFLRAVDELRKDFDKMVFVSGIGCSSWIPSPLFKADMLHVTHGRPIAFATGVKLARRDLDVVVFTGDGDGAAIGGNHLIHAARRNIGLKVILVNNMIYGMTGGEAAPTTPRGVRTATTPFGSLERPFDISRLVEAAGACFVARWTTAHYAQLKDTIMRALERRVFSFVEVVSHCPVQYGRRIGISDPVRMIEWFRKMSVSKQQAAEMTREDLAGKIVVGEFVDIDEAELTEEYEKLFERHGNE